MNPSIESPQAAKLARGPGSFQSSPLLWALVIAGLTVVSRLALARLVPAPNIFGDEWLYVDYARVIPLGRGMLWNGYQTSFPCWLFPLAIAPFVNLLPTMDAALLGIQALNSVLAGCVTLIVFAFARRYAPPRHALAASAASAFMPGLAYTSLGMADIMFLAASTLAFWLSCRALERPTLAARIAAGASFGIGFHVKPHGLFLPFIFFGAALMTGFLAALGETGLKCRIRALARATLPHWLTALAWGAVMLVRVAEIVWIEKVPNPLQMTVFLGTYSGIAAGTQALSLAGMFKLTWVNLATMALAGGLLPFAALIALSPAVWRARGSHPATAPVCLGLFTTLLYAMAIARHTLIMDAAPRIHERYFMVVVPLHIVVWAASRASLPVGKSWAGRIVPGFVTTVLLAALWVHRSVIYDALYCLPTDCPSLVSLLARHNLNHFPDLIPFMACVCAGVLLVLGVAAVFLRHLRIPFLLGLLAALNAGWYAVQHYSGGRWNSRYITAAKMVDDVVAEGEVVAVLSDGLNDSLWGHVGWRVPTHAYRIRTDNEKWYLDTISQSQVKGLVTGRPAEKWIVISSSWKVKSEPLLDLGDAGLYRLDSAHPIHLDRNQLRAHRNGTAIVKPESQRTFDPDYGVQIMDVNVSGQLKAGRQVEIEVLVRNSGSIPFPSGLKRMALGYHWVDGKQQWNPVIAVWDDGRQFPLREGLEPHWSQKIKMLIEAPETPGNKWTLVIEAVILEGDLKTWGGDKVKFSKAVIVR